MPLCPQPPGSPGRQAAVWAQVRAGAVPHKRAVCQPDTKAALSSCWAETQPSAPEPCAQAPSVCAPAAAEGAGLRPRERGGLWTLRIAEGAVACMGDHRLTLIFRTWAQSASTKSLGNVCLSGISARRRIWGPLTCHPNFPTHLGVTGWECVWEDTVERAFALHPVDPGSILGIP